MNRFGAPTFEAVARTGEGVFPTLKALAALVLESLNRRDSGSGGARRPAASQQSARASTQLFVRSAAAGLLAGRLRAARDARGATGSKAGHASGRGRASSPAHAPATRPVAAASRPAPAAVRPAPVARAATRVATRPTAQHVVRKAAPVAAVVEDDSPSPKSKTGVWVGIALGGLGALRGSRRGLPVPFPVRETVETP